MVISIPTVAEVKKQPHFVAEFTIQRQIAQSFFYGCQPIRLLAPFHFIAFQAISCLETDIRLHLWTIIPDHWATRGDYAKSARKNVMDLSR